MCCMTEPAVCVLHATATSWFCTTVGARHHESDGQALSAELAQALVPVRRACMLHRGSMRVTVS